MTTFYNLKRKAALLSLALAITLALNVLAASPVKLAPVDALTAAAVQKAIKDYIDSQAPTNKSAGWDDFAVATSNVYLQIAECDVHGFTAADIYNIAQQDDLFTGSKASWTPAERFGEVMRVILQKDLLKVESDPVDSTVLNQFNEAMNPGSAPVITPPENANGEQLSFGGNGEPANIVNANTYNQASKNGAPSVDDLVNAYKAAGGDDITTTIENEAKAMSEQIAKLQAGGAADATALANAQKALDNINAAGEKVDPTGYEPVTELA